MSMSRYKCGRRALAAETILDHEPTVILADELAGPPEVLAQIRQTGPVGDLARVYRQNPRNGMNFGRFKLAPVGEHHLDFVDGHAGSLGDRAAGKPRRLQPRIEPVLVEENAHALAPGVNRSQDNPAIPPF
jgi:hypothetical protein